MPPPRSKSRKYKRRQTHKKQKCITQKWRGGDEAIEAKTPDTVAPTSKPHILVQCFPNASARELFKINENTKEDSSLKNKYLFRIENIQKSNPQEQIHIKKELISADLSLGDISKIKFKGNLVPSEYILLRTEKVRFNTPNIPFEFRFSGNFRKIIPTKPIIGQIQDRPPFSLSSGMFSTQTSLNYIPRADDMFRGDIKRNLLVAIS